MSTSWPPGHPVTAAVLITNQSGHLLIVHPAKTAPWQLPGGVVEAGESPLDAARREVREELGLDLDIPCDLFAVEWLQATRPGRRDRLAFLFTGPILGMTDADRVTLQREELDAWRWATHSDAEAILHPSVAARITRRTVYREIRNERTL